MAALILCLSTLVALLSQPTNAGPDPQTVTTTSHRSTSVLSTDIPYPFNPYPGYCPDFGQYPPFYLFCACNLAACFDIRTEAQLEAIALMNRLRLCDVQQWAAIIEGTMTGINDVATLSMIDEIAQAVRHEMDIRGLRYDMDYPAFCQELFASLPPVPLPSPVLMKRSPDVIYPDMLSTTTVSTTTMESYYYELMYLARNIMPYLSPQLQMNLLQTIMSYTPYGYLGLTDVLQDKLEMNLRSMFSEMDQMTPFNPLYY